MKRSPIRRSPRSQDMSQQPSGSLPAGTNIVAQQTTPIAAGVSTLPASSSATGTNFGLSTASATTTTLPTVTTPSASKGQTSSSITGTSYAVSPASATKPTNTASGQYSSASFYNQQIFAENNKRPAILPALPNLNTVSSTQMESLQSQINALQAQLVDAQRALSAAFNSSATT